MSFSAGGPIALASDEPRSLAARIAERVAAVPGGVIRSYRSDGQHQARNHAALWRQAGDVAAALGAAGAAPGAFVVILADDILDFIPAVWGCLRGGFAPVALMSAAREAGSRADEVFAQAVASLDRPLVVADEHFAALLARLTGLAIGPVVRLSSVMPASSWTDYPETPDPAWLVATSGSTGRMKLAAMSPRSVLFRNFAKMSTDGPAMRHALGVFPLDGGSGQHAAFLHHESWTQIPARLVATAPLAILDAIEAFEIAYVLLTTSVMRSILVAEAGVVRARRLGALRLVGLGAEPVLASVAQPFAAMLARHGADPAVLVAGYGATETGSLVVGSGSLLTADPAQPTCLGRPWNGIALRIVNERGDILPEGETGALEVSCPAKMFSGYWNDPAQTEAAFTEDGWWRTGDLGRLMDGALTLDGRVKHVLMLRGRKIALDAIDATMQQALGVGGVAFAFAIAATAERGEALGVAFDPGDAMPVAEAVVVLRSAIVRRFGLEPERWIAVAADRIPRTASGKIRRIALSELSGDTMVSSAPAATEAETLAVRLGAIWSDVLGLDHPPAWHDGFFDHGGDSLRAVTLDLRIAEAFGVRVPSEAFFADPTFITLLRLVRQRLGEGRAESGGRLWPLSPAQREMLRWAVSHWPGTRDGPDAVISGHNLDGDLPPLFWVFNVPHEAACLAAALGPRRPLFAIRSGHQLIDYREDEIQAFALCYVAEIERLCPSGPLFLGGNCQGGILALAVAQHLSRRGRAVPLLMLLDWSFALHPYPGRVLMLLGGRNPKQDPRDRFARPERAWSRYFGAWAVAEVAGPYAREFDPPHGDLLARTIDEHMTAALAAPPAFLPHAAGRAVVSAPGVPRGMQVGERRAVEVMVTNASDTVWDGTAISGLSLGGRWMEDGVARPRSPQPRADLPRLDPGESANLVLMLTAPDQSGEFTVEIDLVEDGQRWFDDGGTDACRALVRVTGRQPA